MNQPHTDDEHECYRQAAALVASLLVADTDTEADTALRQVADGLATFTTVVVIGTLAGIIHDLLDEAWEADDPERLEYIATRVDLVANAGHRP